MKLSVIIPAYNLDKYIADCVISVCQQITSFEYEVIVCDDASTDTTAACLKQLDTTFTNLRVIIKPVNQGLAENMKTLLSHAKGEYIAYVDGDDLAYPGKLQTQVDYLDANPECGMVFHESNVFDSDTGKTIKHYTRDYYNFSHIPVFSDITHLIRFGTYLQASSVMFRRHEHLLETVLEQCKIILDYPFYIMNAGFLNARIDFIDQVLGGYRIHNESFGAQTQKSVQRRLQSLNDIVHACQMASQFGVDSEVINEGVRHHHFAAALFFLFKQKDEEFRALIEQSVQSGDFVCKKHQLAWQHRSCPNQLREMLSA